MERSVLESKSPSQSEFLASIRGLPPFHPVASEVLNLFSSASDGFQLDELASILNRDPAFAAELLQTANSPLFGLKSSIHTVTRAIIVLGLEHTKSLAIRTAMQIYLKGASGDSALQKCWLHSLACAEIASLIMTACGHAGNDQAYTAGLLHDVGRLALLRAFGPRYVPLLSEKYASVAEVVAAEQQIFGFDHCRAGHSLCVLWNFPPQIGQIALQHHEPLSDPPNSFLNIVRLSCQIADVLGFAAAQFENQPSYELLLAALPAGMQARCNWSPEQLRERVIERTGASEQS
jgi:HD-like signal output (HDOD) protein